jgi:hypothetical protein
MRLDCFECDAAFATHVCVKDPLSPSDRNTELALQWLSSERAVMNNQHAAMFLQYKTEAMCVSAGNCSHALGGNGCCAFSKVYSEPIAPGCNQTFWNFSHADTQAYFTDTVIFGPNGLGNDAVDGCFTDDSGGLGEEHGYAALRMGIDQREAAALSQITVKTLRTAQERMVSDGKFNWQLFQGSGPLLNDSQACATYMRGVCGGQKQGVAWIHTPSQMSGEESKGVPFAIADAPQQIAAFLIGRGQHAWIGYGWIGCDKVPGWHPAFDSDVGVPVGNCTESASGVFEREYSHGMVRMDCGKYEADLPAGKATAKNISFVRTDVST